MKLIAILVVLVFLAISAGTARADCLYNGRWYPTGTNVNGLICQADGKWG